MTADSRFNYHELRSIAIEDVEVLLEKDAEYGGSWKRRGGVGAFMMLARKWDRLENIAIENGYNVFAAAIHDSREEGVLDDIADLRRYLLLVEEEIRYHLLNEARPAVGDEEASPAYVNQE